MKKLIRVLIVFVLLFFAHGCSNEDLTKQQEYDKCTAVCAAVIEDDFTTLEICRQECRKQFLEP